MLIMEKIEDVGTDSQVSPPAVKAESLHPC